MAQPTRVGVVHPREHGLVEAGRDLVIEADAESGDAAGGRRTSILIRVFYRVNGIPFAHVLYNDDADEVGGNKLFQPKKDASGVSKVKSFKPEAKAFHSVRVVSWDNRAGSKMAGGIKQKLSRFRVV